MKAQNNFSGKTALVTGSSSGIGASISLAIAKQGVTVIVGYRKSHKSAQNIVKKIHDFNGRAEKVQVDVSDYNSILKVSNHFIKQDLHIDILINNAGEILRPGGWQEQDHHQIEKTVKTNLLSVIYTIKIFTPNMIKNNYGRIINISSTFAKTGAAAVLSYTASKAGVDNITKSMARELGKFNITVNGIAPAVVDTEMTRGAGEDFMDWAINNSPLNILVIPYDIAEATIFLIKQSKITGHILTVDAGLSLNVC